MKRRQTIWFIAWLSIATVISSCDTLLDVKAKDNISGDIFTDQEGIQLALNGAYFNLGGISDGVDGGELFGGDFVIIPSLLIVESQFEMDWDDINGPSYTDFVERQILATNLRVESNWRRAYETINTLNSILENIDNVSDSGERTRIQGETTAMRGILYFELVRLWGSEYASTTLEEPAIPLLLEPVENPGRFPGLNSVDEIYTQIEEDLIEASDLLQSLGLNENRLNFYVCQAYLMRVALHKNDYTAVVNYANTIIDSNVFELTATPQGAFNNVEPSSEDIFTIQQTIANNAGDISTGTGLTNYYSSLTGQGLGALRIQPFYLTDPFGDFEYSPKYSPDDLRGGANTQNVDAQTQLGELDSAFYQNVVNNTTYSPNKYTSSDRVIPVIRLAEVILSRAEALAFQSPVSVDAQALADYNSIRTRAGLDPLMDSDFFIGVDLYDSIILERRREFLYEGILFHDMKRRDETLDGVLLTDPQFILPIPQSEQDLSD